MPRIRPMSRPIYREHEFRRERTLGPSRVNAPIAPRWLRDWVRVDYGRSAHTVPCAIRTPPAKARPRRTSVRDRLCGGSGNAAVTAGLGVGALHLSDATLEAVEVRHHERGRSHHSSNFMSVGTAMHRNTAFGTSLSPLVIETQLLSAAVT